MGIFERARTRLFTLRLTLFLLVLLAVVPALGLALYADLEQRRLTVAAAEQETLHLMRLATAHQEQLLEGVRNLLLVVANLPEVQRGDGVACGRVLAGVLRAQPLYLNLGVARADGSIFCSALPGPTGVRIADRLYFQTAVVTRAFAVGEYQVGRITGRPSLNFGTPVLGPSGEVIGVAFGAVDLRQLGRSIAAVGLPPHTTFTVLDRAGVVLASWPPDGLRLGQRLPDGVLLRAVVERGEGTVRVPATDGATYFYAFTQPGIVTGRLYLLLGRPTTPTAAVTRITLQHLAGLILVAALGLAAAWVAGDRLVVRRVEALVAAARRLSAGDLSARAGAQGRGELAELARAFDEMAAALERRQAEAMQAAAALAERERELRLITDSIRDGLLTVDEEHRILFANPAAGEIFGYTPQELVGRPLTDLVPERLREAHRAGFARYVQTGERRVAWGGIELPGLRRDGREVVLEISLSESQAAGRHLFTGVVRDITARRQAEEERRRAEEARRVAEEAQRVAEQANQAKSEFLSRMSHELRTPLNAILGFAQLLEMDNLSPEQRESVADILKAGRHLLDLINEVLDIARIEAGRLALSPEPVPLREVAEEALALITPLCTEHGVRVEAEAVTASRRHVIADRQRLKQVLLNLLANAVKYNRAGGLVTLSVEPAPPARLRLKVTDTGPGIPADRMARLFVPFERLGAEQTAIEGTGLGLALSRRLVEAMGGTLGVESTVGRGSTFWVELPEAEEPALEPSAVGAARPEGARRARIVYIEDNLSNLKLLQRVLAHRPEVELLPAIQGRLGLDLIREHRPDLVLLDLHLPDMPGDEVLRRLQAQPETREIPVVVISADATPHQIERLRAMGAQDYLTKPLDVRRLLELLDRVLDRREGRHVGISS